MADSEGGLLLVVQGGGRGGSARVREVRARARHGGGLTPVTALFFHEVREVRHPFNQCHAAQNKVVF